MPDEMTTPEEMTDEQLEQAMVDSVMNPDEPTEEPEEVAEAEPEEAVETEEVADAPVEEVVDETPVEPEEAPEGEEASKEKPEEDIDALLRETDAKLIEGKIKHFESVMGRHMGRLGHLENLVKTALGRTPPPPQMSPDDEYDQPAPPAPQTAPRPQGAPDEITTWAVGQAMRNAAAQFAAEHPTPAGMDEAAYRKGVEDYLASINYDASRLLEMNDPVAAQRETSSVLQEAYWHISAQQEAARREQLLQRKADQTSKLAKAKAKASVSATASTPPPKPKAKTLEEMTDKELEDEMMKATGGRW